MKVVSFKICPFVQRLIGVLELKQVEYAVDYISLMDKPDWFLKASPHGKVPILIEERGVLFESGPIFEYVDETYGDFRLHPADPFEKARHRAWIELAARYYLVQCRTQRSPTEDQLEANRPELSSAFSKIEAEIDKEPYFSGEKLSMVDAAWFVILHRTHIIEECTGVNFLDGFPKMKQWQQELLGVEELLKSAPEGFLEEFVNFYLHEGTHLGTLMKRGKGRCGSESDAVCNPATLHACCA